MHLHKSGSCYCTAVHVPLEVGRCQVMVVLVLVLVLITVDDRNCPTPSALLFRHPGS